MNLMGMPPYDPVLPPWAPPSPLRAPAPQPPQLPYMPPPSASFWTSANVSSRLKELHDTLNLAKAMEKGMEMLIQMKEEGFEISEIEDLGRGNVSMSRFSKFMKDNCIGVEFQEMMTLSAVNAVMSRLRFLLEPFRVVADENSPWEEKSALKRLADKMEKYKRNKLWQKRKRRRVAEKLAKEHEQFEKIDKEADEWMRKEMAKDSAQHKKKSIDTVPVEKMEEIAKLKAKEEKKRLESELELVLIVEKLQELRSLRVQKMKKQGHFLPEEGDKFLEQVRAAVEEEERRSMATADTDAAKDAIATIEESRKHTKSHAPDAKEPNVDDGGCTETQNQKIDRDSDRILKNTAHDESRKPDATRPGCGSNYDSVANLPMEFYHYYHGSNADMGTLIEVRRTWDAYIRPGGSRIPGHWVQPPPPADEIWASYLVKPK
ncbi:U11/U12 small nuclear ribonucleoprotein 59 kDa protein-like [Salvia splendens]|uniref:U11/U12 small nuclear ribonucleoprotein 59 kDa protein-like n=1 Tax=Salvia splendens TaxID=180675 RepID=UPI001C253E8A|nr:U11/U12 small nuclear ribonucleoprotein 59 kDa protein-like [Salvia splendens]